MKNEQIYCSKINQVKEIGPQLIYLVHGEIFPHSFLQEVRRENIIGT